jgi:prepilin-type N-terminal cleavage/methylation domain-containing protein
MSMTHGNRVSHFRADERGFTLVEMLVSITMGLIVLTATFALLSISRTQSARIIDRVSADQRSRSAFEQVLLQLHSSCVAIGETPIREGSTATTLKFVSRFGSEPAFTTVRMHEVSLSGSKLIDKIYTSNTSSTGSKWRFTTPPVSTAVLSSGVSQSENGAAPMFRYYKYEPQGKLSTTPLTVPLTEADANATAQVTVRFTTAPESGSTRPGRAVDFENSVSLRLTPPTEIGRNEPCE